ncbi:vWA domain-containing protein [Nocardioides caldifontis]|uniref:vWA domain-containing protein n=1 Tax=Nocardioides caldifontis TaxID=2588938 RepID=UPI0011DF437A|nr:VWA domain-containing protein [Nocardioides caldifontis]
MALLDRHIAFVEALRAAGLPVSLSEDLDAVEAVTQLGLADREALRAGLAATLVKREGHRTSFDALFDLWFPPLLGAGVGGHGAPPEDEDDRTAEQVAQVLRTEVEALRQELSQALQDEDADRLRELTQEAVGRFGAMPGRGQGLSSWSSYNALQRIDPDTVVLRLARALMAGSDDRRPLSEELAMRTATRRVEGWRRQVEGEVRRRVAEEKGAEHVARTTVRPSVDRIPFTAARRGEIEEMRRQIYPLARRLASRLAKEQHARRRGPLDFRRTVRASVSTGGVPLTTHHRPRRPHRTELVVLCDVSGSVANFAAFTLLLVYALQEQFSKVRAFTFVDDVAEVTGEFRAGADPEETLTRLTESARHASLWGRTDYGRALREFRSRFGDAVGPRSSLLVLGDARSNYTDPRLDVLRDLADRARHAWWLNPEATAQWDTGDSAASQYGEVVPMVECRNLAQLTAFVHDIV